MPTTQNGKKRKFSKKKGHAYTANHNKAVYKYSKSICRTPHVCPDVMCVQMNYTQKIDFNVSLFSVNVFRGNSIFDPDFSGVGGQAMGHDEWAAFYRRYRVVGSSVTVETEARATESVTPVIVPMNTNTLLSSPQTYLEAAYANKGQAIRASGDSSSSLYSYMRTNQIRGGPRDLVQYEADLSALMSTNPVQQWYWQVVFYNNGGALTPIEGSATITIKYFVELYDRETLLTS